MWHKALTILSGICENEGKKYAGTINGSNSNMCTTFEDLRQSPGDAQNLPELRLQKIACSSPLKFLRHTAERGEAFQPQTFLGGLRCNVYALNCVNLGKKPR